MNKFVYVRPEPTEESFGPLPESMKFEFEVDPRTIERGGWARGLLVPKCEESEISAGRMTYQKFMVECLVHTLSEFESSMRPNLRRLDGSLASKVVPGMTEHALHEDLLNQMRQIVRTLSYMVNSASWRESGSYHNFDRFEINRRLEHAAVQLEERK